MELGRCDMNEFISEFRYSVEVASVLLIEADRPTRSKSRPVVNFVTKLVMRLVLRIWSAL